MSKVKKYLDCNKEKARHRNRIVETQRTKANRIRKCKNGTYSFFGADTIMKLNTSPIGMSIYNIYIVKHYTDMDHYFKTGEKITRKVTEFHPVYIKRIETTVKPVSILRKGLPRIAKYYKKQAIRKIRRKPIVTDDDAYLFKGNNYRKDYEVQWSIY